MAALAAASSVRLILLIRFVNGVFLACLAPLTQSRAAEAVPLAVSGRVFAFMGAAGVVGSTATTMQCLSPALEAAPSWLVVPPSAAGGYYLRGGLRSRRGCRGRRVLHRGRGRGRRTCARDSLRNAYGEIACSLREHENISSFRMIVYQGVTGGIPWSTLAFKIMFFPYVGLSSGQIPKYSAAAVAPKFLGGMVGGFVGDRAAQASPRHGRALVGQIAVERRPPRADRDHVVVLRLVQLSLLPGGRLGSCW